VPIPALSSSGTLPPFSGSAATDHAGVSPYKTTMRDIAERFCATKERVDLFRNWIRHRKALVALGFTGAQWVAGSFFEDIETIRGRPPGDIDMVYLVHPPTFTIPVDQLNFLRTNHGLLDRALVKSNYHCDVFFLNVGFPMFKVRSQLTYLFGLFSHQRSTHLWKGMLEVPLNADDDDALAYLDSLLHPVGIADAASVTIIVPTTPQKSSST
jgi:hypothetical protein